MAESAGAWRALLTDTDPHTEALTEKTLKSYAFTRV
jgi:hypothetical protein